MAGAIDRASSGTLRAVSLLGFALIVGSAFGYSFADLLRKRLVSVLSPWMLLTALALGMLPIFVAWWIVGDAAALPTPAYWLPAIASGALNLVANLTFLYAVRVSPLSVTIPVLSLTPVFTTGVAIHLLGEVPNSSQLLGISLVVAGVFLLSLSGGDAGFGSLFRRLLSERGALLMAGVALLWAVTAPLDKVAMRAGPPSFHGVMLNGFVGLGALVMVLARGELGQLKTVRSRWLDLTGSIVATVVGLALQLLALGVVWAALVETLKRAIGSFMAIVLGRLFFGESLSWRKFAAVGLMVGGMLLLLR